MAVKSDRIVAVYFETVEDKKRLERDAKRLGIAMSRLIKLSLEVGQPIVVKNYLEMKRQNQAVKP